MPSSIRPDSLRDWLKAAASLPDLPELRPTFDDAQVLGIGEFTESAVLIALLQGSEPGVLLTKRTSHLAKHAGQVSFPGGRSDPEDADATATALREAAEEIGLDAALVEIIGCLPQYHTGTGYRITPVVALLPEGRELDSLGLQLSEEEVEAVFDIKLAVVLDPAAPQLFHKPPPDEDRTFWQLPHDDHQVWGATAAMLVWLGARLRAARELSA
jgi:8-oxo-dGTP pyrophosphatase MutT (NUDIX family)